MESRRLETQLYNGKRELTHAIIPWWGRLKKLSEGSEEEKEALKIIFLYSNDREFEVKRIEEHVTIVNALVAWEFFDPDERKPIEIVRNIMQSGALFIGNEVHLDDPYPNFKGDRVMYEKLVEYREFISHYTDRRIPSEKPLKESFDPRWGQDRPEDPLFLAVKS